MDSLTTNLLKERAINNHYILRYIQFIDECMLMNRVGDGVVFEKHHILPKSIYPEFKSFSNNPWNMVELTPRQHFIAHWILGNAFGGPMMSALYFMINKSHPELHSVPSKAYARAREGFISHISNKHKGTVLVKNRSGDMFRVDIDDPRYLSGELVSFWTGRKHSPETIEKKRGKRHSHETIEKMRISASQPCPESKKKKISKTLKGRKNPHVSGVKNPSTCIYHIISKDGDEYHIISSDIKAFCNAHNLNFRRLKDHVGHGPIPELGFRAKKIPSSVNVTGWSIDNIGRYKDNPNIKLSAIDQTPT